MGDTHPSAMAGTPEILQDGDLKIYKYPNDVAIYSEGDDVWHYAPTLKGLFSNFTASVASAENIQETEDLRKSYRDKIMKFEKLFAAEINDPNNPITPYFLSQWPGENIPTVL
jgi:hypothetical protein